MSQAQALKELLGRVSGGAAYEPGYQDAATAAIDAERAAERKLFRKRAKLNALLGSGIAVTEEDLKRISDGTLQDTQALRVVRSWHESTLARDATLGAGIESALFPRGRVPFSWLVLLGGVGVGKTCAAAWMIHERKEGRAIRLDTLATLGASKWSPDRTKYEELIHHKGLLVVEEIGFAEDPDAGRRAVAELIDERRRDKQLTIATDNSTKAGFVAKFSGAPYDHRSLSRLMQCSRVELIGGKSMREVRKDGGW
jgi:hypothetical protein